MPLAVLKGYENQDGFDLEELLSLIRRDLMTKAWPLYEDPNPIAKNVLRNDEQIIGLLQQAEALSRLNQDLLDMISTPPDMTAGEPPRIGMLKVGNRLVRRGPEPNMPDPDKPRPRPRPGPPRSAKAEAAIQGSPLRGVGQRRR